MNDAVATPGLSTQPPPPQEQDKLPVRIGNTLLVLHVLLVYGRHLALTLDRRSAAGRFAVIAQFFGTARLPIIRARIARGLLRIQALQHVLLARARRGRDLVWLKRHQPPPLRPRQAETAQQGAELQNTAAPPRRQASRPRPDPDADPDPDHLPTLAQLEAQIRRRPIGLAIADICRDLGVGPALCYRQFFGLLSDDLNAYHGNIGRLMQDFARRRKRFEPEWDRDYRLGLPDRETATIRTVLGFFIGEVWPRLPNPLPPALRLTGMVAPPVPP